jgi:uncharacterized coiled-coil protein SlyX
MTKREKLEIKLEVLRDVFEEKAQEMARIRKQLERVKQKLAALESEAQK